MCDEFVCSDSGVVSLCEDDRRLLASLGDRKKKVERKTSDVKCEKEERFDNNNVASETNRNLSGATKTDDEGIEGSKYKTNADTIWD